MVLALLNRWSLWNENAKKGRWSQKLKCWLKRPSSGKYSKYKMEIFNFICHKAVLDISLVLLPQSLDPFGPPKKCFNFGMSIFLSEAELLNCSDISGELSQNSYPIQHEYSNFVLFLLLEFCLSPKLNGTRAPIPLHGQACQRAR